MRTWLQKWVWITFSCKVGQSDPIVMKLTLGMSSHLLNVYAKFQIDISKLVGKSLENSEGGTDEHADGRTLPRHHTTVIWEIGRQNYARCNQSQAKSTDSNKNRLLLTFVYWVLIDPRVKQPYIRRGKSIMETRMKHARPFPGLTENISLLVSFMRYDAQSQLNVTILL